MSYQNFKFTNLENNEVFKLPNDEEMQKYIAGDTFDFLKNGKKLQEELNWTIPLCMASIGLFFLSYADFQRYPGEIVR